MLKGTKMIKMQFDQFGNIKMDVEGMVGVSCKEATRQLEAAFIGKKKDEEKPEYYESESSINTLDTLRM